MTDFPERLLLTLKALSISRGSLAAELAVDKSVVSRFAPGFGFQTPGVVDGLACGGGGVFVSSEGRSGGCRDTSHPCSVDEGVPEPASWALMILGFGAAGGIASGSSKDRGARLSSWSAAATGGSIGRAPASCGSGAVAARPRLPH